MSTVPGEARGSATNDGRADTSRFPFDQTVAGKRAECDGGGLTAVGLAGRDEFAGTLTGIFVDHGQPPSRWYLMTALEGRPKKESAWCEQGFLFVDRE